MAELITKQQRAEDTLATNTFEHWDKYTLQFRKNTFIIYTIYCRFEQQIFCRIISKNHSSKISKQNSKEELKKLNEKFEKKIEKIFLKKC